LYFRHAITTSTVTDRNNEQEIAWLNAQPDKLLTHYQPLIMATVSRFIARGFFQPEEKEELVQVVNLELLERRLSRMQTQFTGEVFLRTYFTRVVYNICVDQTRMRKREPRLLDVETLTASESAGMAPWQAMALQDELRRWEAVLRLLPGNRIKNELCLQLFARVPPSNSLLGILESDVNRNSMKAMTDTFAEGYETLNDKEVFTPAARLFNDTENKNTDGDSLRRWTQLLADQCIEMLNGNPPVSSHSRESLRILIRLYYETARA